LIPEDSSEEENPELSSEEEQEPHYKKQQEKQLSHIKELIADVENQTQLLNDETEVVDDNKEDPNWLYNLEQYLTVVSWLDNHYDLLDKLQQTAEDYYESIQKCVTVSLPCPWKANWVIN